MQHLCGLVRRCVDDYGMIEAGDRIAVGISGGKDSLALLVLLAELRKYYPKPFSLEAMTVDMGLHMDFSAVEELCHRLHVPYTIIKTDIAPLIFDIRQEKNPCSMCAKMRRGALHSALQERGLNKIALGHHYDDAVETFFLSLFYEGRLSCFQPVTWLDRTQITQIRPLLYCGENLIRHTVERLQLPVVHNPCPANGSSGKYAVFATLVLGAHAYGVTELEGGGLEHIVKQLGYGDDPLNQRASVGWKGMRAAERLVEQYMVRIESLSSYSASAAAN